MQYKEGVYRQMINLVSREDFQALLEQILQPLKTHYSESGALLQVGKTSAHYPDRVAMLEGFARPLWGLVPFWKGGGCDTEFEDIYVRGFVSGTDPHNPDYWDAAGEVNQRYVEMAAISLGLLLVPEILWEPLPTEAKTNLAAWLGKINTIDLKEYPDCNWWFFVILTNLALKSVKMPYRQDMTDAALQRTEAFYLGGGWYQDGMTRRKDYYISFAIHFYSLIYAVFMEKEDPVRCREFKERADKFAGDFLYWFDDRGRAVPYGRSLTYRFAQSAFWSAYVYAGLNAVPSGVVKGILSRHLQEWMSCPIFDDNGVLTIGYSYPNLNMAETYNAPGSPYWAMKAFLILALPDEHPFWQMKPEPMPVLDDIKYIPDAKMLIQRRKGHTVMYPSADFRNDSFGHMPEKYGKFAYSTEFGFSVATGNDNLELSAPDSMLAFMYDGYIFTRRNASCVTVEEKQTHSHWSPIAGISVETIIIPTEKGHIRRHTVRNDFTECTAYDCGFAVPAPAPDGYLWSVGDGKASVSCNGKMCSVISDKGRPHIITAAPNTNLIHTKTAIPCMEYRIPTGVTILETEVLDEIKENKNG